MHAPLNGPRQLLTRGSAWLGEAARQATRLPAGHPEAFIEAFANIYRGVAADVRAREAGLPPLAPGRYATVEDGARGVRFIEATVASARSEQKWTPFA